jgi:type 1 glutamine amidotransferase
MGDHPYAWAIEIGKVRAFYTGLGHEISTWQDPDFRRHLLGAITWAAGRA